MKGPWWSFIHPTPGKSAREQHPLPRGSSRLRFPLPCSCCSLSAGRAGSCPIDGGTQEHCSRVLGRERTRLERGSRSSLSPQAVPLLPGPVLPAPGTHGSRPRHRAARREQSRARACAAGICHVPPRPAGSPSPVRTQPVPSRTQEHRGAQRRHGPGLGCGTVGDDGRQPVMELQQRGQPGAPLPPQQAEPPAQWDQPGQPHRLPHGPCHPHQHPHRR